MFAREQDYRACAIWEYTDGSAGWTLRSIRKLFAIWTTPGAASKRVSAHCEEFGLRTRVLRWRSTIEMLVKPNRARLARRCMKLWRGLTADFVFSAARKFGRFCLAKSAIKAPLSAVNWAGSSIARYLFILETIVRMSARSLLCPMA